MLAGVTMVFKDFQQCYCHSVEKKLSYELTWIILYYMVSHEWFSLVDLFLFSPSNCPLANELNTSLPKNKSNLCYFKFLYRMHHFCTSHLFWVVLQSEVEVDDLDPWFFPLPSNMCSIVPGSNHDFMNPKYRVVLSSPVVWLPLA